MSMGGLQGEVLSPHLFNLFICDLEEYMRNYDCRGLSTPNRSDAIDLVYADDFLYLSDSAFELNKKLEVLCAYCHENCLTVNAEKS